MLIRRYYKYEGIQQAIFNSNTPTKSAIFTTDATTRGLGGARRTVSAGEGLQNTLRRLLEHSDSRENVYSPPVYAVREYYPYYWSCTHRGGPASHRPVPQVGLHLWCRSYGVAK